MGCDWVTIIDPSSFCKALSQLFSTAEELERTDLSFRRAAEAVLMGGVEPLYAAQPVPQLPTA